MSIITIQCRLVASEGDRQQVWQMMSGAHTPLVNRLLQEVALHPEFEQWKKKGYLPAKALPEMVKAIRKEPLFIDLPGRWVASAQQQVAEIYKSWFKLQQQLVRKLDGQRNWLKMLESDENLAQAASINIEQLKEKTAELLQNDCSNWFAFYRKTEDPVTKSAIAYILKHRQKIPKKEENLDKLTQKRREVEIKIERLEIKLGARLPKGRHPMGKSYLEILDQGVSSPFDTDEDFMQWQSQLLSEPNNLPFPVDYNSNGDLSWSINTKGRLCVRFSGLGNMTFQIYCDRQQLSLFQRFYEDQAIFKRDKETHSQALFTLRSATLMWKPVQEEQKGDPWQTNYLYLNCTIDTQLWTQEGTDLVRAKKAEKAQQNLSKLDALPELSPTQQQYRKRQASIISGLNGHYPRPQRRLYQGNEHLILGVGIDMEDIVNVALVDIHSDKILKSRSIKQLLGKDYSLVHRLRYEKRNQVHLRKVAQEKDLELPSKEANLAIHAERLTAKAIISFAQENLAGSIALPNVNVGDIRENNHAKIKAKAEIILPDAIMLQKKYIKQHRINAHRWSYRRFLDAIHHRANKQGLIVEEGRYIPSNKAIKQAKEVALSAYQLRNVA
jgi:hypothetical protein